MNFLQTISGKAVLYTALSLVATSVHPTAGAAVGTVLAAAFILEVVVEAAR